jgi:hypothetical protein
MTYQSALPRAAAQRSAEVRPAGACLTGSAGACGDTFVFIDPGNTEHDRPVAHRHLPTRIDFRPMGSILVERLFQCKLNSKIPKH